MLSLFYSCAHSQTLGPSNITFARIMSCNDSMTAVWRLLPSLCSRSENFTVMLSNNTTAIVSSGVLSYMFSDLAPDTCYNITIIANSCSGSGLPVSKLHCTSKHFLSYVCADAN